jgi:C2 domain
LLPNELLAPPAGRRIKFVFCAHADPYVKIYLVHNGQRIAKKKTHVKKRTLNPVFNESFVFDLPPNAEALDNISLEFLVLDWDRVTKNEVSPPFRSFTLVRIPVICLLTTFLLSGDRTPGTGRN